MYDVSSITVVRALNDLAKRWLYCPPTRKGYIVSRTQTQTRRVFRCEKFLKLKMIKLPSLSIERGNKLSYLEKLGLRGDQFYYKIERVRKQMVLYTSTIHLIFRTIHQRKLSKS